MSAFLTAAATLFKGRQRPLVIALCLLPLLVVTVCCIPALVVLPFWPTGHARATELLQQLKDWSLHLRGTDQNE
ncbi:hypothetical protein ACYF6T_43735 [Streptomyces sp. 7R007]